MSDKLGRIDAYTDFPVYGGVRVSFVAGLVDCTTIRDVTGDHSIEFTVLRNDPALAYLVPGAVVAQVRRNVKSGTETRECWRIRTRVRASGDDEDLVKLTARSAIDELARGDIFQVLTTGETARSFDISSMTPSEIIDTFVLPAMVAAGLPNFARGTVDPTVPIEIPGLAHENALGLLQKVIADPDAKAELQVRDGGSVFFIDLVTQIGADAARPTFALSKNVLQHQLTEQTQDQVTRCVPKGRQLPGLQERGSLKRMLLRVTSVTPSGGNLVIGVADPDPDLTTPLIGMDNQFAGWCVFRQLTGVTFPITVCSVTSQTLTIAKATYPTTLAVGELIELRRRDNLTQRIGCAFLSPGAPSGPIMPYVKAIDGVQLNRITVYAATGDGSGPAVGGDMVPIDGAYADLWITFCAQILSSLTVAMNAAQRRLEYTGTFAGQAGDLIYCMAIAGNASPPHNSSFATPMVLFQIQSVDSVNKYAYVEPYFASDAGFTYTSWASGALRVVTVRPDAATRRRIQTSSAALNTVDLTENAPSVLGQVCIIEQWASGEFPSYVEDPVAVQPPQTGYGIIARPLDLGDKRDEGNIVRNPLWKRWTTPANPPDGWSVASSAGNTVQHSQNTSPAFIRFGGASRSWYLNLLDSSAAKVTTAVSPPFGLWSVGYTGLLRCAVMVSFYLDRFAHAQLRFRLRRRWSWQGETSIADYAMSFVNADDAGPTETVLTPGSWYQFSSPALTSLFINRQHGFELVVDAVTRDGGLGGNLCSIYLDAVAVYQVEYDPQIDTDKGAFVDGSYANRYLVRANQQLTNYAPPRRQVALRMLDLERVTGDEPVVLGGNINLRNPYLGSDTPRVTRMSVPEFDFDNAEYTLTTPDKLTNLLVAAKP